MIIGQDDPNVNDVSMSGITLIGMPGAGKSTIGRILADRLRYSFIDLDEQIKDREGRSVGEIARVSGAAELVGLEEKYALKLVLNRCVVSPGGSIVYSEKAMNWLSKESTIYFLDVPCEEIRRRIGDASGRGIVSLEEKSFDEIYAERRPLYEQYADEIITYRESSPEEVASEILKRLGKR